MRLRISRSLLALPLLLHQHAAQDCFFPDGSVAPDSSSCSTTSTGQCCPLNWQCLSNGLCWLETESFFGRYSCTDQAWQSASCPQICTHNLTAGGNEAVRQCPDGRYCCDGDRSFDCCDTANANYFALPPGSAYASVTAVASPTTASSLAASSVTSSGQSSYLAVLAEAVAESSQVFHQHHPPPQPQRPQDLLIRSFPPRPSPSPPQTLLVTRSPSSP